MIKDSGERTVFETGFQRDMHAGKGRFDLLPWHAIWEVAKHCEEGALKYGERNIDKGAPQHSLIDSAFRHMAKYTMGMTDEDHLRAAAWNILWALEQEARGRTELMDIPTSWVKAEDYTELMDISTSWVKAEDYMEDYIEDDSVCFDLSTGERIKVVKYDESEITE